MHNSNLYLRRIKLIQGAAKTYDDEKYNLSEVTRFFAKFATYIRQICRNLLHE